MEYIKEGHMVRYKKGAIKDTEQFVYCKLRSSGPDQRPEIHIFTDASSGEPNSALRVNSFTRLGSSDADLPKIVKAKYDNYICICAKQAKGAKATPTYLAADSRQQRDEWCELLQGIFDQHRGLPAARSRLHTDISANRPAPNRGRKAGMVRTGPASAIGTFQEELGKTIQTRSDVAVEPDLSVDELCCPRHHEDAGTGGDGTENIYENVHRVPNLPKWREERHQSRNILQKQSQLYKYHHQLTNLQVNPEEGIEDPYGDTLGSHQPSDGNRWSSSSGSSTEDTGEGPAAKAEGTDEDFPDYAPPAPPPKRKDSLGTIKHEDLPDSTPPEPTPKLAATKRKDTLKTVKHDLEAQLKHIFRRKMSEYGRKHEPESDAEHFSKRTMTLPTSSGRTHESEPEYISKRKMSLPLPPTPIKDQEGKPANRPIPTSRRKMSLPTLPEHVSSELSQVQDSAPETPAQLEEDIYINYDIVRRRTESRSNQKPVLHHPSSGSRIGKQDISPRAPTIPSTNPSTQPHHRRQDLPLPAPPTTPHVHAPTVPLPPLPTNPMSNSPKVPLPPLPPAGPLPPPPPEEQGESNYLVPALRLPPPPPTGHHVFSKQHRHVPTEPLPPAPNELHHQAHLHGYVPLPPTPTDHPHLAPSGPLPPPPSIPGGPYQPAPNLPPRQPPIPAGRHPLPPTIPRSTSKAGANAAAVLEILGKLKNEKGQGNTQVQIPKALLMRYKEEGLLFRQRHHDILITRVPRDLSQGLRVGDQLVKINDQLIDSVAYAHDCIALSDKAEVTVTVNRIPSATLCNFRWVSRVVRDIGLTLDGPKITDLKRAGLAARFGNLLSNETQSMLDTNVRCKYVITEINFHPVDPDATTTQVHEMLLRAGKEIVLLLHPEDFAMLQRYPEDDLYEDFT